MPAETLPFQHIPHRPPIHPGRLHGDLGDVELLQPAPHARQIVAKRAIRLPRHHALGSVRWQHTNHNSVSVNIHSAAAAVYRLLHLVLLPVGEGRLKEKTVFPLRASHYAAGASISGSHQRVPATLLGGLNAPFLHSAYIAAPASPASRHSRPFSSPVVAERRAAIGHTYCRFGLSDWYTRI